MKKYLILASEEPAGLSQDELDERNTLLASRPKAAVYNPYILMAVTQHDVDELKALLPDNKVDLSDKTLGDEGGMTESEFLALHDQMAAEPNTGRVVILSVQQGRLLHKERYAPAEPEPI